MSKRNSFLVDLRKNIDVYFSESEFKDICFTLNLDYSNLSGETKSEKVRELITYLKRRNRLRELLEIVKEERPNVDWYNFHLEKNVSPAPPASEVANEPSSRMSIQIKAAIITGIFTLLVAFVTQGFPIFVEWMQSTATPTIQTINPTVDTTNNILTVTPLSTEISPIVVSTKISPTATPGAIVCVQDIEEAKAHTPYKDASIRLLSAQPVNQLPLQAGSAVPYSYEVEYFIPDFDWTGSCLLPRIQLAILNYKPEGGFNFTELELVDAKFGSDENLLFSGQFIVPNDRETLNLQVAISFRLVLTRRTFASSLVEFEHPINQ